MTCPRGRFGASPAAAAGLSPEPPHHSAPALLPTPGAGPGLGVLFHHFPRHCGVHGALSALGPPARCDWAVPVQPVPSSLGQSRPKQPEERALLSSMELPHGHWWESLPAPGTEQRGNRTAREGGMDHLAPCLCLLTVPTGCARVHVLRGCTGLCPAPTLVLKPSPSCLADGAALRAVLPCTGTAAW